MKNIFLILILIIPIAAFSQEGSVADCRWTDTIATSDQSVYTYRVTWSALGSGSQPQSVTFLYPQGTLDGWDVSSAKIIATDMPGNWVVTEPESGIVKFEYADPVVDGQYAIFSAQATHDGNSDKLGSNTTNVQPGRSECSNTIDYFGLPVEMSYFTAEADGSSASLKWETLTEENASYFDVEASSDGVSFVKLGEISSKADRNGNSDNPLNYDYLDKPAATRGSLVYYRLKQVDLDGTFAYSEIRLVNFEDVKIEEKIFPNPISSGDPVLIQGNDIQSISIYDSMGKLVGDYQYENKLRSTSITTNQLSAGTYYVVVNGDKKHVLVVVN